MGIDIALDVASQISSARVFGSSENIRHGRYIMVVKRIFADIIETSNGKQKMAFAEARVIKSEPVQILEGDRGPDGKLIDDGSHPNTVGSYCALKVNFDGPGARSAGANLKAFILGLCGKREGEISEADVNSTWLDLSRQRDEWLTKGFILNGQVVPPGTPGAMDAMVPFILGPGGALLPVGAQTPGAVFKRANPGCGMLIACWTKPHKKKVANEKGAYITKTMWECVSPPGTGENAPELVKKRREDIERAILAETDDEEPVTALQEHGLAKNSSVNGHGVAPGAAPGAMAAGGFPVAPAAPEAVPPAPPAPPAPSIFMPQSPWKLHPTASQGKTPETTWYWSDPSQGGNNSVRNLAQLQTGG